MMVRGFFIGLAMVAPVGPVALALIGVAVERGRRRAISGALGIAAADLVVMMLMAGVAMTIGLVDTAFMRPTRLILGVVLVGIGVATIVRSDGALARLRGIEHPARTFLSMTLLNPLTGAVWLGVIATLPADALLPGALMAFGVGIVFASLGWHLLLGLGAAWVGPRLGAGSRRAITIVGGIVIVGLGLVLALRSLA